MPAPLALFKQHAPEEFVNAARSRTIKPVKPHGKPGGIQRTPLHACDKAANQDLYDIFAERQEKAVPKYLVRWKGFGTEDDTWEPIEHLAGAEDYIARFVEEILALMNCLVFICLYQHLFCMYVIRTAENAKI